MITFLFVILIIIGLPLWVWLASRISQENHNGALLGMVLVIPAFYWTYKLWHSRRADLQKIAIANGIINFIALPALVIYSTHYATQQADAAAAVPPSNPTMTRWCKEQNDAVYDPYLQLCVEPSKEYAQTQEQHDNLMGQLEQYLNKHGIAGALDRKPTPETTILLSFPDIAIAASYQLTSATAQPPMAILLCRSESACSHFIGKEKKEGKYAMFSHGKLVLLAKIDAIDDQRFNQLKKVMTNFAPQ